MTSKLLKRFSQMNYGIVMTCDDEDNWECETCRETIPAGTRMLCSIRDLGESVGVQSPVCKACVGRILEDWDE